MKKIIISLMSVHLLVVNPVQSMEALGGAAKGVVEGLMPLLEPLAKELIIDTIKEVKALIRLERCPDWCINPTLGQCKLKPLIHTNWLGEICKGRCQIIKPIGGYSLRVRFGIEDNGRKWDLTKCVKQAIDSGYQEFSGKGNPRSIAIYSQEDLDNLLELIGLMMAAKQVENAMGANIPKKVLEKEGKTAAQIVEEAKALRKHIAASIEENVKSGEVYGPQ